jgi:hypothetical protein
VGTGGGGGMRGTWELRCLMKSGKGHQSTAQIRVLSLEARTSQVKALARLGWLWGPGCVLTGRPRAKEPGDA